MFKKSFGLLLVVAMLLVFGSACSSEPSVKSDDVVSKFKEAGLEAENPADIVSEDMGLAPMKFKEGKRIFLPSLGEKSAGRIFIFEKQKDLEELKKHYDELGKTSAMFFSHTAAKGDVLIMMPGKMEKSNFEKYKKVIDSL
ncbi:hypothetical protein [Paenibacillus sp. FJAT-26967]|uniref:hypothetical protein n=1 Tax=Paenibacillus sp. FJAT-26967 TaxID=1729690 RepID=UPI000837D7CE|nr:hypothetical protein [Paenibacillus sp. FJAT-26967]